MEGVIVLGEAVGDAIGSLMQIVLSLLGEKLGGQEMHATEPLEGATPLIHGGQNKREEFVSLLKVTGGHRLGYTIPGVLQTPPLVQGRQGLALVLLSYESPITFEYVPVSHSLQIGVDLSINK